MSYLPANHDARIVRRSNAVLGTLYGPSFSFDECLATTSMFKGYMWSMVFSVLILSLLLLPPARWVAKRWIPKPGEGPSEETRDGGKLELVTLAKGSPEDGTSPAEVEVKFSLKNADPGYKGTAIMLVETAMCLVEGSNEQFGDGPVPKGGVLTPASACGGVLLKRLNANTHFDIRVV